MNNNLFYGSQINPIDMSPFIGVPQDPEARKRKLIKLYMAEAKDLLDKGEIEAYNLTQEKIKELENEINNSNQNQ